MLRQIKIQLINKIRKPLSGNKFLNGILKVLTVLLYPIFIIFGFIYFLVIVLIGIIQSLIMPKRKKEKMESDLDEIDSPDQWMIWTEINGLKVYKIYKGEVRFGPIYFQLKGDPIISILQNKLFGDWLFQYKKMLFLQLWNSTKAPDSDLILIDTITFESKTIIKNIPSVLWEIVETNDNKLQLNCDTGQELLTYEIEINNVNANN